MGVGKGLRMYMLLGAIMFGLFAGTTAIFGEEVGAFEGGLVEDDPNCVLATDEDFSGITNGSFRYRGSAGCVKIPHVIKGEEVTSYRSMFNFTDVNKVISDNPNVTNMDSMFAYSQAAELDLSNFDTSNVTNMSDMFSSSEVTELDVSSFNTSNVTNMEGMFKDSHTTGLDLSSFNTSNVTNMEGMFEGSHATELDVSRFNTSNVTNMDSMFRSSQVTELDLSSFDTSNVTNMEWMFSDSQATELDLSSFDTSNVTNMGMMFYNSQATTVNARTQEDADKYNESNGKPNGLQVIVKDREPNEGGGIVDGEDDPNCVLATDEDFSGTSNGSFRYRGSAGCVQIPHVIKGEEVTSYENMFRDTKVSKVISDNPNVTDMSNMFYESKATELDLSNFDTSKVTDMDSMFSFSKATELDLSNFDTSKVTTMMCMFCYSRSTELDLSSFDTSNVTSVAAMFAGNQDKTVYVRTQADADKLNLK